MNNEVIMKAIGDACRAAADTERNRIVAWIRRNMSTVDPPAYQKAMEDIADSIESDQHRTKGK